MTTQSYRSLVAFAGGADPLNRFITAADLMRGAGRRLAALVPTIARSALALAAESRERMRMRRALESMDDRMLRDIGITRLDVWGETSKPLWKD